MSASAVARIQSATGELTSEENTEVLKLVVGLIPDDELVDVLTRTDHYGILTPDVRESMHSQLDEEFGEKEKVERTESGDPESA